MAGVAPWKGNMVDVPNLENIEDINAFGMALFMLQAHEGFAPKVYKCTEGYLTIGYGRNLETNGVSHGEAMFLLKNDLFNVYQECINNPAFDFFRNLNHARQAVILDMVFNMGFIGFFTFRKTIDLIKKSKYEAASIEMLDSKWAKQVKGRAIRLSEMMKTGEWRD